MTIDRRHWPWGILLLGVTVFVVLVATRPRQSAPAVQPRAWPVEAIAVQPRRLQPVLTLYGSVEAPDLMQATAPAASQVVEVGVREGQKVKPGQLLVRLDPRDFRPGVQQAKAAVAELEAQLELERQRYRSDVQALAHERRLLTLHQEQAARLEKLHHRGLAAEAALDQARMEAERQEKAVIARQLAVDQHPARLRQLQAQLEKARARLLQAEVALQRSRVTAPFAGVVAEVAVAEGDRVGANQLLVSLFSWRDLEVRAKIPAPFHREIYQALEQGHRLRAEGESLGLKIQLRLERLAGRAEAGGIDAFFQVAEGARQLRLKLPVTVRLQRPARDHAVAVPYTALYGSRWIYRIVDGRLQSLAVEPVGDYPRNGRTWLLVHSPELRPGDRILITHLPNATDGLAVKARLVEAVS